MYFLRPGRLVQPGVCQKQAEAELQQESAETNGHVDDESIRAGDFRLGWELRCSAVDDGEVRRLHNRPSRRCSQSRPPAMLGRMYFDARRIQRQRILGECSVVEAVANRGEEKKKSERRELVVACAFRRGGTGCGQESTSLERKR